MARSLTGPFAFCGIAVCAKGVDRFHLSFAPAIAPIRDPIFRVASVSKVIVGGLCDGPFLASDMGLRHPRWPDVEVTGAMLAAHTSGLRDAAGYAPPADLALLDWIAAQGAAAWHGHPPGHAFDYSNLGYLVLATALEKTARFDELAAGVLQGLGIAGGFNWAGVSASDRTRALPTYRRDGAQFVPQIDAQVPQSGVMMPDGALVDLKGYRPGRNAALFSPQGGLRTDMDGLLKIAKSLAGPDLPPIWSPATPPPAGVFDQYGAGVQLLRAAAFYPRPLRGHFANAYGFKGGVWYDAACDLAFAYALNGAAMGDESDDLDPAEEAIFAEISRIGG